MSKCTECDGTGKIQNNSGFHFDVDPCPDCNGTGNKPQDEVEMFKKFWYSRNPCHDRDPLGRDRFFQTAELVAREYGKHIYKSATDRQESRISDLEDRIESMKCCATCKWCSSDPCPLVVDGVTYEEYEYNCDHTNVDCHLTEDITTFTCENYEEKPNE